MDTRRLQRQSRLAMFAVVLALAAAAYFFYESRVQAVYTLRVTAGDAKGRRHELAELLAKESKQRGLNLRITPTSGSEDAIERVAKGELDAALVQGGLPPQPGVLQAGALYVEPLHVLVRPDLVDAPLGDLDGRRVNLSTRGSGTRRLSLEVLEFAGLRAGTDFEDDNLSYSEILKTPADELPDAIFIVSSMPSEVVERLVHDSGYRLKAIEFGEALGLRHFTTRRTTIPAMAYSADPPVPTKEIETVGNMLLLVANEKVPQEAVFRLLESIFDGGFARAAQLPSLSAAALEAPLEYAAHPGLKKYKDRNNPAITAEAIEGLENIRSFLVSIAVAAFLLWQWYRRRQSIGFEKYLAEVTRAERRVLEIELQPTLDLSELLRLRQQVSHLKSEALEKFAEGSIVGEELMAGFLAHVGDLRTYLNDLILHERERLEKAARAGVQPSQDAARIASLWTAAVGDFDASQDDTPTEGRESRDYDP